MRCIADQSVVNEHKRRLEARVTLTICRWIGDIRRR
jgi:hypothetical protein